MSRQKPPTDSAAELVRDLCLRWNIFEDFGISPRWTVVEFWLTHYSESATECSPYWLGYNRIRQFRSNFRANFLCYFLISTVWIRFPRLEDRWLIGVAVLSWEQLMGSERGSGVRQYLKFRNRCFSKSLGFSEFLGKCLRLTKKMPTTEIEVSGNSMSSDCLWILYLLCKDIRKLSYCGAYKIQYFRWILRLLWPAGPIGVCQFHTKN